ncbi:hypothetical protein BC349_09075 [Flavihumibacter stibioxidans]|uniref:Uncharacterized protein n=1 Tax=Flavihumibacter stibioxidans TaxID=1834163 RepID=A0ABR7M882_9BACT|nr:hypothetical protein [Flavihumibacter stibioxidans]
MGLSNTAWPGNSTPATSTLNNRSRPVEEVAIEKVQYHKDETMLTILLPANGNEKTELRLVEITGWQKPCLCESERPDARHLPVTGCSG